MIHIKFIYQIPNLKEDFFNTDFIELFRTTVKSYFWNIFCSA